MTDFRDRIQTVFFTNLPSFPDAPCTKEEPDLFFPDPKNQLAIALAKSVCGGCAYRARCLEYALNHELDYGIFGATTPEERHKMRPRRDRRKNQYTINGGAA